MEIHKIAALPYAGPLLSGGSIIYFYLPDSDDMAALNISTNKVSTFAIEKTIIGIIDGCIYCFDDACNQLISIDTSDNSTRRFAGFNNIKGSDIFECHSDDNCLAFTTSSGGLYMLSRGENSFKKKSLVGFTASSMFRLKAQKGLYVLKQGNDIVYEYIQFNDVQILGLSSVNNDTFIAFEKRDTNTFIMLPQNRYEANIIYGLYEPVGGCIYIYELNDCMQKSLLFNKENLLSLKEFYIFDNLLFFVIVEHGGTRIEICRYGEAHFDKSIYFKDATLIHLDRQQAIFYTNTTTKYTLLFYDFNSRTSTEEVCDQFCYDKNRIYMLNHALDTI